MKHFSQLCEAIAFSNNYGKLRELGPRLAFKAHRFLFPEKSLSMSMLVYKLASELNHDPQVISDMVHHSETELIEALASESQGEDRLLIEEAFNLRHKIVEEGRLDFVETASQMGMMEAKVFWHSVLDRRPRIITQWQFMRHLTDERYERQLRDVMSMYEPAEVMEKIFFDTHILKHTKMNWWELDKIQLQPKRFLSWGTDDALLPKQYNDGWVQYVPRDSEVKWREREVTLDGRVRKVWLEVAMTKDDWLILDAVWPHAPEMGLFERLLNADNMKTWFEVQKPTRIPRWENVIEMMEKNHVRVPHLGKYDPYEKSGFMIVKDKQTMRLRLQSINPVDDKLYLIVDARDGIDYTHVGLVEVTQLEDKTALFSKLRMVLGPEWNSLSQNWFIPEETCIVVNISSPYLKSGQLVSPVFLGFDDEAGASDVIQLVDMMAAPKEDLLAWMEEE